MQSQQHLTYWLALQTRTAEGGFSSAAMKLNLLALLSRQFGSVEWGEEEIDRCIGILRTNGMKLEQAGLRQNPGVALYPVYCLINSACYSNTNYIKTADLELQLRAQVHQQGPNNVAPETGVQVAVAAGAEITTRYVSSTLGNPRRRQQLSRYWYRTAVTALCCTQLQVFRLQLRTLRGSDRTQHPHEQVPAHALLCCDAVCSVRCGCGDYLVQARPLEAGSSWQCSACSATALATQVC